MAEEQVCKGYMWLADILTQNDNVTRATSPTVDTVDASGAASDDGHEDANALFTAKTGLTPAQCIAHTDRYDTNQAISRIMQLYNMDRSGYYKQAVESNNINRERLKFKQNYTDKLLSIEVEDTSYEDIEGDEA